eukprot:TRINITY_DN3738_c0_g1_i1.p1 TRINITY_DN3738_c0_g1~~TRINITY_DN3738_c0_g1_i1.p1  ORF type:complete len:583 (-),score=81.20 TRINITY_DN3738_c0_g1_i1:1372-3093(-)
MASRTAGVAKDEAITQEVTDESVIFDEEEMEKYPEASFPVESFASSTEFIEVAAQEAVDGPMVGEKEDEQGDDRQVYGLAMVLPGQYMDDNIATDEASFVQNVATLPTLPHNMQAALQFPFYYTHPDYSSNAYALPAFQPMRHVYGHPMSENLMPQNPLYPYQPFDVNAPPFHYPHDTGDGHTEVSEAQNGDSRNGRAPVGFKHAPQFVQQPVHPYYFQPKPSEREYATSFPSLGDHISNTYPHYAGSQSGNGRMYAPEKGNHYRNRPHRNRGRRGSRGNSRPRRRGGRGRHRKNSSDAPEARDEVSGSKTWAEITAATDGNETPDNSVSNKKVTQKVADEENLVVVTPKALETIDASKYNPTDFNTEPENARFFVIKSYMEDDVHKCIKYNVWASTDNGNKRLDAAFGSSKGPIYLFFSVNGSGQFCGMAQMLSAVDHSSKVAVWAQDKWKGMFKVKWIFIKDIPNSKLRHIKLPNNDNRPVTNSRDTQEILKEQGLQVLSHFHCFVPKTSILDVFDKYDEWEKTGKSENIRRNQKSSVNKNPRWNNNHRGGFKGKRARGQKNPSRKAKNNQ